MKHIIKTTLIGLALTTTSSLTAIALEKAVDRTTPPAAGTPKNFTLPAMETYSLQNGMQVTLVQHGRVPKAIVRAVVRTGNLNDGNQPWISDFTADMMQEGAGDRTSAEVAAYAARMGGDLSVGVGPDQTFAAIDILAERVGDAVGLIADVLQRPQLPAEQMEKVRANMLRSLSVAASQPGSIADHAFQGNLYPDHPYGIILPNAEKIGSYGIEDVRAFHKSNFGAQRTHLYVIGRFDQTAAKTAIEQAFGGWGEGPMPLDRPVATAAGPEVILINRDGAVQSTIRLGKRVPALSSDPAMSAMNTLLGGSFSSRITNNIREDKGYTYSPRSLISAHSGTANWQQNADVSSAVTGPALFEIIKEIKRMQTEAPTEAEVTGTKNYMNGIYVLRLASRAGLASQLAFVNLHELGEDYLSNYVSRVQALTGEDLQQAAAENLKLDDLTLVIVGDKKTVLPQLMELDSLKDRLPTM